MVHADGHSDGGKTPHLVQSPGLSSYTGGGSRVDLVNCDSHSEACSWTGLADADCYSEIGVRTDWLVEQSCIQGGSQPGLVADDSYSEEGLWAESVNTDSHSEGCPWADLADMDSLAGVLVGDRCSMAPAALVNTLESGPPNIGADDLTDFGGNMHLAAADRGSTVPAAGKDHGEDTEIVVVDAGGGDDGVWQMAAFADAEDVW